MRDLIVDGYNVLHAVGRYRSLLEADLALARARLVDDLASFSVDAWRTTVVFDGAASGAGPDEAESVQGVRVLFAMADSEADAVVEGLARDARDAGREAFVVTADGSTVRAVLGGGVVRMSPRALDSAMEEDARERADSGARRGASVPIERRVGERTRSALLRMRDGSD